MQLPFYLAMTCSAIYGVLSFLILFKSKQNTNIALSICCGITAVWAFAGRNAEQSPMEGWFGLWDLMRLTSWYTYLLFLYRKTEVSPRAHLVGFSSVAVSSIILGIVYLGLITHHQPYVLYSLPIVIRLTICIFELLLIENLYLNLPETARWHIAIPCVLLGGLACVDIFMAADAVLFSSASVSLTSARLVAMIIIAPLLVIAASRGLRWHEPVRLSRTAVFHSATLVLSGSVLFALALAGEVLRRFNDTVGWIAELSLLFAGIIGTLLILSSKSARSIMQRIITRHFFADRYDYRLQWLECIGTLSGTRTIERTSLPHRAIRAVADIVNSPCGALFLLDQKSSTMLWAGSWNMPSVTSVDTSNDLVFLSTSLGQVVEVTSATLPAQATNPFKALGTIWLIIPLLQQKETIGLVVVGPPRTSFFLDQEVFDLLRIVGQEVATYIAEQRATEIILQTRNLHDYAKRFAFVAHDIKNVSSQLSLLLNNARSHIRNPEFQQDMLDTIRASTEKIDGLLRRLDEPETIQAPASITPLPRVEALVAAYMRVRKTNLTVTHDGSFGTVAMSPDAFDTAVTHLLNNAVEASPGKLVQIRVHHEAGQVVIEIQDHGPGMSLSFIQDALFKPFKTDKKGGSGIGAFQARELIEEAGGQLLVTSEQGIGTTMRLILTRSDQTLAQPTTRTLSNAIGDDRG